MRSLPGTEPPAASGRVRAAPPVGRDADLAALAAVVERARAGESGPRLAVLRGDPGVGKSTLLRAVAAQAASAGGTVLAGRADDLDRRTPYAMFADALRLAADPAPGPLQGLGELDATSPSLAGQVPALVAERVAGLLRVRGRRGLCVLTLDDLHAADDDSIAALANLIRRLPGAGCVVLAALRARPPELPVRLAALLERLAEEGSATIHELGPLAADSATELAARWLDAAPDAALAAGLWEWCRGNPFYLRQALRSLEEAGALVRSAEGVSLASATRPTLTSTSLVRLRLARLGGAAERTAQVLTAFGAVEVHDLAEVAELTGHPIGDAERTFDQLVAAGFLDRSPDGRFSFSHPIVRDTLHAELGPAERRRLHGAIAARLLARRDAGSPVPVPELAHHLAESAVPGDRRAVAVLAEAGDSALPQAPHAAARWLRRALELLPPGDAGRGELLLRLARALYVAAGADDELVAVGGQAIEALPAGPDRDWVAAVTVAGLGMRQRPQEALALADRALAGHDLPMPSVLAEKARMLIHLGRPDEAVALAQEVFELGAEARIPMVAVGTLVDIASYGGQVAQSKALFTTALAAAGPDPTPDRLGVLCRWAVRLASYGELARAQATIQEAEALHGRFGGAIAPCGANLRAARAIVAWLLGRWDEVLHEAARPPDGRFVIEEITLLLAADVHLERGAIASAAAIVERLGAQPAFPLLWAWVAAGVAAGNDAQDAARQLLGAAVDAAARARLWGHAHPPLLRLVELEHEAGNVEAAWRRMATLEWAAAQADIPLANVLALRARGLLAADPAPLRRALAIADEHGLAVQAALARSQLGCLGESPAEQLPVAMAAFRAFGAERRRRRAAAELRARGIPVPRRPRQPSGMLTDTEVRLAHHVADGLTNREIAEAMSLSAGTVATYLVRVFAKTGAANRRALGRAVRRGELDHDRR